jgi:hypothetical protein
MSPPREHPTNGSHGESQSPFRQLRALLSTGGSARAPGSRSAGSAPSGGSLAPPSPNEGGGPGDESDTTLAASSRPAAVLTADEVLALVEPGREAATARTAHGDARFNGAR